MSILDLFRTDSVAATLTETRGAYTPGSDLLIGTTPPPRLANDTYVTADAALGLPAVYSAVSLIAVAVSQLDIVVRRTLSGSTSELLVSHENNNGWLKRPDAKISRHTFVERTTVHLATAGNAYWRVWRENDADPVSAVNHLEILDPHEVLLHREKGRYLFYYRGDKLQDWQVKHLRLLDHGKDYGLGPIQACNPSLMGAVDLREYSSRWFRDSGVPNGVLKSDMQLTPEQADQYREAFSRQLSEGRMAVLGSGTTYSPVYLNPVDAQFIENQKYTTTDIARLFRVPAIYMLADGGNSQTYTNNVYVDMAFVRYTLKQYTLEIAAAFSDLLPRGQEAEFDFDALISADVKTRYESHASALSAGWKTVNEVRAAEGLPPVDGGDEIKKPQPVPAALAAAAESAPDAPEAEQENADD